MTNVDSEKGASFDPVLKTYLNINEIRLNPNNNYITFKSYKIPNLHTSERHKGKVVKSSKIKGRKTNLPKSHFFAALLLRNEILGCTGSATDKHFLIRNMRKEYPDWKKSAAEKYVSKFYEKRKAYNNGTLYSSQSMPPLYCFFWNEHGYIRHPTLRTQLLSFKYCKRHLTQEQFADPRFFTPQEITELQNRQLKSESVDWHVPTASEISSIEAQIKKPIYDSIEFPSGYGKNYDPI